MNSSDALHVWASGRWGRVSCEWESGARRWSIVPALFCQWCQVSSQTGDTGQHGASILHGRFSQVNCALIWNPVSRSLFWPDVELNLVTCLWGLTRHHAKQPGRNLKTNKPPRCLLTCVYFCLRVLGAGGKFPGVCSSAEVPGRREQLWGSRRSRGPHDWNHREGEFGFLSCHWFRPNMQVIVFHLEFMVRRHNETIQIQTKHTCFHEHSCNRCIMGMFLWCDKLS